MEPVRVLIAEDEPPMGRFIKTTVEKDHSFLCWLCESAEDALKMIRKYDFDLLITDICMPGRSGLELISLIKSRNPDMQFIIISGYKEFSYAKEAISLGIEAYLTKPIDMSELHNSLARAKARIQIQRENRIAKEISHAFAARDNELLSKLIPYHHGQVVAVYCFNLDDELIRKTMRPQLCFRYKTVSFYIEGSTQADQKNSKDEKNLKYRELFHSTGRSTGTCLIVSDMQMNDKLYENLHRLYQMTLKSTILGKVVIKNIRSLSETEYFTLPMDEETMQRITATFSAKNIEKTMQQIRKLFALWKEQEVPLYYIRHKISIISENAEQTFLARPEAISLRDVLLDAVSCADNYDECCNLVIRHLQKFVDDVRSEENSIRLIARKKDLVLFNRIKQLVEENQGTNYSLQEICQLFGISQPYVRSLFKKYTGKNYKDYMIDSKISLAKQLIQEDPDIMVKDVAAKIGYEQMYFATVFNRYVSMSPTRYKQICKEKTHTKKQQRN